MPDDVLPSKTEHYWHCPCGIFTVILDFTPKMRKIKRIRPRMNWSSEEIRVNKMGCVGWMQYMTWDWSEDVLSKDILESHFDRFKKAGIGFMCGCGWEEHGKVFNHCLDAIFDAVEKNIPDGKEPVENVAPDNKELMQGGLP